MEIISSHDRQILREIAARHMELATSPRNAEILKQWESLANGKKDSPTVRLLFSNFTHEVITPRMRCSGKAARDIEFGMLWNLVGRELFDDDTPLAPFHGVSLICSVRPFGADMHITRANGDHAMGFHIDPVVTDLSEQLDMLRGGGFSADIEATNEKITLLDGIFGDILPVRRVQPSLSAAITNPLVHLMGMENYYCAMYDTPDELHEAMEMATRIYEDWFDYLEKEQLLLPTHGVSPLAQESFTFNSELPTENITSTRQVWGFMESQETTAVSPATFGEFVFPYQDRLAKRFGLLSYGCCERVDAIWPDYLSKWKNLRKLSVSPFNNEMQIGEYLRGTNVIYYSKPRAEFVTHPGPMNEEALRKYFKMVCQAASGCLFEMAQREVGTIFGDIGRGKRYVQIAKECIAEYWMP